jgi:hypothetical protein
MKVRISLIIGRLVIFIDENNNKDVVLKETFVKRYPYFKKLKEINKCHSE